MECSNWIKLVWWKCLFHIRRTKHVKWQLFRPLPSAPPQPLFLVSSLGSLLNINPPISSYSCKNRLSRLSERHPTFSGTTICLDEETGFFHVFAQLLLLHLWHYQDSGAETSETASIRYQKTKQWFIPQGKHLLYHQFYPYVKELVTSLSFLVWDSEPSCRISPASGQFRTGGSLLLS